MDNYYIDEFGIKAATREAMRRAIVELKRQEPDYIEKISATVDGNDHFSFDELPEDPICII